MMPEHPVKGFVARSQHDRGAQLTKLAKDRRADLSVILGASWRIRGIQAHIDYLGGFEIAQVTKKLASLATLNLRTLVPLGLRIPRVPKISDITAWAEKLLLGRKQVQTREKQVKGEGATLKNALSTAAPVGFQSKSASIATAALASGLRDGLDGASTTAEGKVSSILEKQQRRRVIFEKGKDRNYRDFADILSQVSTHGIANLAHELLRQRRQYKHQDQPPSYVPMSPSPLHRLQTIPLPHISDPFFGSAHLFYVIQCYNDQLREHIRWIIKIPVTGTPERWDDLGSGALRTETLMLDSLRKGAGVPVPEVIDADNSPNNAVRAPYIIMEYVQGRCLEDVWFEEDQEGIADESLPCVTKKRRRILENVAEAMLHLGRYEFDRSGSPLFNDDGILLSATSSPSRELDVQKMVDRWIDDEGCEHTPLYLSIEPQSDPKEVYTAFLDARASPGQAMSEADRGVDGLLRLLIHQTREPGRHQNRLMRGAERTRKKFVLAHPNLSMHNIIMADDRCTIKAILGWDGVRIVPRSLGYEALPRWLVRDFNPFIWRWRPAAAFWKIEPKIPPSEVAQNGNDEKSGTKSAASSSSRCDPAEDPPWVLRELRECYVQIMEGKLRESFQASPTKAHGMGDSHRVQEDDTDVPDGEGDVNVTRQSLLTLSLDAAVRDPRCTAAVLRRILEKCSRPYEEFDLDSLVGTLGDGLPMDQYTMKCLKQNMKELVDKGHVRGAVVW